MTRSILLPACFAAGMVLYGCGGDGAENARSNAPRPPAPRHAPNVVVVMTDDQVEANWQERLPGIARHVAGRGMTFSQNFASTPLCCPSRATFLTGQYSHNSAVRENSPGYPDLREPASVLPEWLRQEGYRTAHVGKWLQGYESAPGTGGGLAPAPGWDQWDGMLSAKYYDYDLSVDGRLTHQGDAPSDHADRVISRHGLRFVRQAAGSKRPFFLSLAYLAPHKDNSRPARGGICGAAGKAVPTTRDLEIAEAHGTPLASDGLNEADTSDKPPFIRERPPLDQAGLAEITQAIKCEDAALRAVDRGFGKIVAELRRAGELDRTLILFTSDNGLLHGEHRIAGGKSLPYAEAVRVPLAIRPPGGAKPQELSAITANVDLAPTILDYAGADPCVGGGECREVDGRSLRPLVEGVRSDWSSERAILMQSDKRVPGVCRWRGVRTSAYSYVTYRLRVPNRGCTGRAAELYESERDVGELENLIARPRMRGVRAELSATKNRLTACAGQSCR